MRNWGNALQIYYGALTIRAPDTATSPFVVQTSAGAAALTIFPTGGFVAASATGGDQGLGTINATGLYVNGAAVSTGGAAPANPSATIGLAAVNGSASTFIRSDGAPALSQAIVPTWTGAHTFSALLTANAGVSVTGTVTATNGAFSTSLTYGGIEVGFRAIPQLSKSANYVLVLGDAGKHVYMTSSGHTVTIPANSSVAFGIGTAVTFVNPGSVTTTIACSDTMYLSPAGTTGSRTLAPFGIATAIKTLSTTWQISGSGLT